MEHILTFGDVSHENWMRVPYVARTDYISVSFFEYSRRNGLDDYFWWDDRSIDEVNSLVQTLFFFAFLQEVLGPFFVHDDFIGVDRFDLVPTKRVTTARLLEKLELSLSDVESRQSTAGIWADRIKKCRDQFGHLEFIDCIQQDVLRSIKTCLELCSAAVNRRIPKHVSETWALLDREILTEADVMSDHGWCRYHAARALESFESSLTCTALLSMDSLRRSIEHRDCSIHKCMAMQVPKMTCYGSPYSHHCKCELWQSDATELRNIIETESIVVLKADFTASGELWSLRMVPARDHDEYIAISHVWADGLGNPNANALRMCAINAIIPKLLAIRNKRSESNPKELFFWLDTLCCPVEPEWAKLKVLSTMTDIYQNASEVLVLDAGIEACLATDTDVTYIALVVLTSLWMWRVWTLQEGVLANDLWFKFADDFIDADQLLDRLDEAQQAAWDSGDDRQERIRDQLKVQLELLRQSSFDGFDQLENSRLAIRLRSLTVSADEGICLGNLLRLETAVSEDIPGRRMSRFWKGYAETYGLPDDFVTNRFPRLNVPGFGWAPSTMLQDNYSTEMKNEARFGFSPATPRLMSYRGLLVHCPGRILRCIDPFTSFRSPNPLSCKSIIDLLLGPAERRIRTYDAQECQWYMFRPKLQPSDKYNLLTGCRRCVLIEDPQRTRITWGALIGVIV